PALLKKTQENDENALMILACHYLQDVQKQKEVLLLLEQAHKNGNTDASSFLGNFYFTKADYKKAINYLTHAANQDVAEAQALLGEVYLLGKGAIHNDEEAIAWLKKAADKGHAFAQANLGNYYLTVGKANDIPLAIKYLNLAVDQGMSTAIVLLGRCYATGVGVEQSFKRAFELYCNAAQWNEIFAIYQVGAYFLNGRSGGPPNQEKALLWFLKAAELGDADSQASAASLYFYGEERDEAKGFNWLAKAITQKNKYAYYVQGLVYRGGTSLGKDDKKAYENINLAAQKGWPAAQFDLAMMLLLGTNPEVIKDEKTGLAWLEKAAQQKYPIAVRAIEKPDDMDDILMRLQRCPTMTLNLLKYEAMHLATIYPLFEFVRLSQHDKNTSHSKEKQQLVEQLIGAAKSGNIIAQAMLLASTTEDDLSENDYQILEKQFWQHADEVIYFIQDEKYKFIVMDRYWHLITEDSPIEQKAKVQRLLGILVEQKYPQALARLGASYLTEYLGEKDTDKALTYLEQGASYSDPDCLCSLGYYYESLAKTDSSAYQQAFKYHQQAAKLNNPNSCNQLGTLYRYGHGVTQDLSQALKYYELAIELDSGENCKRTEGPFNLPVLPHAYFNLAFLYWDGVDNVLSRREEAKKLFIKAAQLGHEEANKAIKKLNLSLPAATSDGKEILPVKPDANGISFWHRHHKEKSTSVLAALKRFSKALELMSDWKTTTDDKAWCYIQPEQLAELEKKEMLPFRLRKTKTGQTILLLEELSRDDLMTIIDKIIEKNSKTDSVIPVIN
ncbi:MAG: SEL1-like repeat protein, partial [Pseudomonadota bacterium]